MSLWINKIEIVFKYLKISFHEMFLPMNAAAHVVVPMHLPSTPQWQPKLHFSISFMEDFLIDSQAQNKQGKKYKFHRQTVSGSR